MRPLPKSTAPPATAPKANPFGVQLKPVSRSASTAPASKSEASVLQRSASSLKADDKKPGGIVRSKSTAPVNRVAKVAEDKSTNGVSNPENGVASSLEKVDEIVPVHNMNGVTKPPSPPKVQTVKRSGTSVQKTADKPSVSVIKESNQASKAAPVSNSSASAESTIKRSPSKERTAVTEQSTAVQIKRSPSKERSALTERTASVPVKPNNRSPSKERSNVIERMAASRSNRSVSKERSTLTDKKSSQVTSQNKRSPSKEHSNITERIASNGTKQFNRSPSKERSAVTERVGAVQNNRSPSKERSVLTDSTNVRRSPSVPRGTNGRAPSAERSGAIARRLSATRETAAVKETGSATSKATKTAGGATSHSKCLESGVQKTVDNNSTSSAEVKKVEKSQETKKLQSRYLCSEKKAAVPKAAHLRSESNDCLFKNDSKNSEHLIKNGSFCKEGIANGSECHLITHQADEGKLSVSNASLMSTNSSSPGMSNAHSGTSIAKIDSALTHSSDNSSPISIKNKCLELPSSPNDLQLGDIHAGKSLPGTLSSQNSSFDCIPENCSEVITPVMPSVSQTSLSSPKTPVEEKALEPESISGMKYESRSSLDIALACQPSCSKSFYEPLSKTEEIRRKISALNKPILKKRLSDDDDDSPSCSIAMSHFPTSGFYSESLSQSITSRMPKAIRTKSVGPPSSDEDSVVISAGMSFLMGARKRPVGVKHHFSAAPAYTHDKTVSAKLTKSVKDFLKRTDHVMQEWKQIGNDKRRSKSVTAFGDTFYDPDDESEGRAKSERRFSWKEWKKHKSSSSEEFKSATEDNGSDVFSEDEVSELTTDLAEEHSTAVLATERLEAETSERLKLEKDVKELQLKLNSMTQDHDRLEFEVLCSRASHLGANSAGSDDLDAETDAAIYKQKYERCSRDLEFMKEKLRNQHEDDLEQMVTLKKQLEKKLADAYEEVEEQRQVAAQWKRKAQRLGQEANDTKLLLEEQATRNAVLEKKQRKFDGDMQVLQEEIRQDRSLKERLQREREMALAEKEQIERDLQSAHLELEMRGERLSALQREVEALSTDGKSDTEVATLRRAKLELENKVKDQEEELDDLAGQVQMLESAKVRLELQLENLRKDYKRELSSKDEEVEDVRCSAQKKVKAIEAQLEAEHEERTTLVREKHELERRLLEMTTLLSQSTNDEVVHKLKKELKKSKALLKDAQVQLEHAKSETPSKVLLRQLKNQLEDAEFARTAAVKGRQHAEQELQEMQIQYEELQKLRNDAEDKYLLASRERGNLQTQLDDLEAEMSEVMRKYKSTVQQLSIDQLTIQDQAAQITNLEQEKQALKESLAELNVKLENIEGDTVVTHTQKRLELKIKELESKAELELTSRQRLETQISRLKETVEKYAIDLENCRAKEQVAQDTVRRLQRQLRDLREELSGVSQRDTDASQKVRELEQAIDILEGENEALKRDLNIALRRIDDLQSAMQGDSESHESDAQLSDSDSDDSLATVDTLLSSRRPLPGSSQSQTSTSRRNQSRTPSPVAL